MICEVLYNNSHGRVYMTSKYKGTNGTTDTYQCIFGTHTGNPLCFDYSIKAGAKNDVIKAFYKFVCDVINCLERSKKVTIEQRLQLDIFQLAFGSKNTLDMAYTFQKLLYRKKEKDFVPTNYLVRFL